MPLSPASALMALDGAVDVPATAPGALSPVNEDSRSQTSEQASQTASEFISNQLKLEAEARDVLPYSFDTCTKDMGPLRQNLFACLTCNPPPKDSSTNFSPAGVCYSCSISCHGEHELVELFTRRNFVCDCGTTRLPSTSPCTLRIDPTTGTKGPVHSEEAAATNTYNQNFRNRFCACVEWYDPLKQKGTMFQCIGLVTEEEGGCGEDWWHPECLVGLPRDWHRKPEAQDFVKKEQPAEQKPAESSEVPATKVAPADDLQPEHPVPPGFPDEEEFDQVICYKCVEKVPWLKRYAHVDGFIGLPKKGLETKSAVIRGNINIQADSTESTMAPTIPEEAEMPRKRSHEEADNGDDGAPATKRVKTETEATPDSITVSTQVCEQRPSESSASSCRVSTLPPAPEGLMSILAPEEFRDRFCRCKEHYTQLRQYPMLLEDEDTYEPPISDDGDGANGGGSVGTGSLLDRGEAALSNVDRVRAIEGVMVYNHLKSKVKDFLKPFAENGQMVSAEAIKDYFEKLRGDAEAIREAKTAAAEDGDDGGGNRREQSGY